MRSKVTPQLFVSNVVQENYEIYRVLTAESIERSVEVPETHVTAESGQQPPIIETIQQASSLSDHPELHHILQEEKREV